MIPSKRFIHYCLEHIWVVLSCLAIMVCIMAFDNYSQVNNNPPVVKITFPKNNSVYRWNSDVPYSIVVSDKEDGNSEYDEISGQEVTMHVLYLPDSTVMKNWSNEKLWEEPSAISIMKTSTCFNCHTSRSKLIGPSFDRIAARYANQESSIQELVAKVKNGSTGKWGEAQMPSNTDLKDEEIEEIIRWILKDNLIPTNYYLTGLKGTFRIHDTPADDSSKGIYILTASYIDHGTTDNLNLKKRSHDSVVLKQFR